MSNSEFAQALSDIRQFAHTETDIVAVREFCILRMAERLPHYNRTGFYMLDRKDPAFLCSVRSAVRLQSTYGFRSPRGYAVQLLLRATRSLLTTSHPLRAILRARSKRDPRSLFRFGSMMGWSARSTLKATGDALSETRIGKTMDVPRRDFEERSSRRRADRPESIVTAKEGTLSHSN